MARQAEADNRRVVEGEIARRIVDFATEMRKLIYGGKGVPEWGTKFTEIEEVGVQIGDALSSTILEQSVGQQAEQPEAAPAQCGACGAVLKDFEPHPHDVRARRGRVAWREPSGYCPRCRRAFFPSVQSAGN